MKITEAAILMIVAILSLSMAAPSLAGAKSEIYKNWQGVAIKGFDPVAYHRIGKPVEGSKNYEFEWKGATWRFASAENRELFEAETSHSSHLVLEARR